MTVPTPRRHTLVHICDAARKRILEEWPDSLSWPQERRVVEEVLMCSPSRPLPGIVRREEMSPREGMLPVGFCSPHSGPGGRARVATFVKPEETEKFVTPFDLLQTEKISGKTPALKALHDLHAVALDEGLTLGVWGSAALELATGLAFTHAMSDLDVLVLPAAQSTLQSFLDNILALEKKHRLRIDAELALSNGFGVSLKELFDSPTVRTVLGKSTQAVELLDRAHILAVLNGETMQETARTGGEAQSDTLPQPDRRG